MKSKSPVGHHRCFPGHFTKLSRHVDWSWPSQKVQINDPTNGVVLEILTTIFGAVDFDIHSIAVYKSDSVSGIALYSMFEIYWMIAV